MGVTEAPTARRRQRPATWWALGLLTATTTAGVTGVSLWPVIVASAALGWFALAPRVGRVAALGLVATGTPALLLFLLLLTAASGLNPVSVLVVAFAGSGLVGSVALARAHLVPRSPGPDLAPLWVPALLGPVVWVTTVLSGAASGSSARMPWTLMGDAITHLLFARNMLDVGGVPTGTSQNPVPLPAALIAVGDWAGRTQVADADLLAHDMRGLGVIWTLLITATCFTAGLAAAMTIGTRYPRLAAAAGAIGSVLPLTWFVSGYAIEFGFYNAHVVLPVLFVCWVVMIADRRSGVAVLLILMLATTVLLATWTPAALVPVALGARIVLQQRGRLVATRSARIVLSLGTAQGLACVGLVVLPGLRGQGSALSADGDVYPLSPWVALASLIAALTVAMIARRRGDPLAGPIVAMAAGSALGVLGLLLVNAGQATVWNYYPLKFAWLTTVLALLVLVPTTVRLVVSTGRLVAGGLVGGVLVLALAVALTLAPRAIEGRSTSNPLVWAMSGSAFADPDQLDQILRGSDSSRPSILWESGQDDEKITNFWILQMLSGFPDDDDPLYRISYSYHPDDLTDLCEITRLVRPPLTVRTAESGLSDELVSSCPGVDARVVVEPAPPPG